MKLNKAETIINEDKFLEHNKRAANFYWNKCRRLAMIYYNRIKLYEERKVQR